MLNSNASKRCLIRVAPVTKPHLISIAFAIIVGGTGACTLPAFASASTAPLLSSLDGLRDPQADALLALVKTNASPQPAPSGPAGQPEATSEASKAPPAPKRTVPEETASCDKSAESTPTDGSSNDVGQNEACPEFSGKASSTELQMPAHNRVYSSFTVKLASLSPLLAPSVQYSLPTEPFDWMHIQRLSQAYFTLPLNFDLA